MAIKMRNLCFDSKTSSSLSSVSRFPPSPLNTPGSSTPGWQTPVTDAGVDRSLENAESIITKWNPDSSGFAKVTSLFYENRREAREFIKCVNQLQRTMHSLVINHERNSEKLIRGQKLMQTAMKRLEKEFYQILSMNRAQLDPESVSARSSVASQSSMSDCEDESSPEDEIQVVSDAITVVEEASTSTSLMADLKSIAECMISSGYGKECVKIYKIMRKSIVDESMYRLGIEKMNSKQIQKMDWELLEFRITNWLSAVKIAVKTLFHGERVLCDHVFASSESVSASCFTDITKEAAMLVFGFPELVTKSRRKSPEKVFRLLDMYSAISENWVEIESVFSLESTSAVRLQAINSLIKLGESVRTMLAEFELGIQKDSSKSVVPGAGVHQLTVDVMDYLSLLADYVNILSDIFSDYPPPEKSSILESHFDFSDPELFPAPAIYLRFAWLILILLCTIDAKSRHYRDVSVSYLFLANNAQHIVGRVRTTNLRYILTDDWLSKHETKVRQFAGNYERLAWGDVFRSLPEDLTAEISHDEAKEWFNRFDAAFESAYRKQSGCVVSDSNLRDEIKVSIARKLVAVYRDFYDTHRVAVGGNPAPAVVFTPEDIGNYLSDLFFGPGTVESVEGSSSSSHGSSHSRLSPSRWFS